MNNVDLQPGMRITVLDCNQVELGDGTFVKRQTHSDMNLTVYECQEHLILAKGSHWVRALGHLTEVKCPD